MRTKGVKFVTIAHIDTSKNSWSCVLWCQQRVEYIWTPHIMAHHTIMWCGNGRETTCHCGCEKVSRTEARPRARPELQFTFNHSLSLFYSACLCHLSFSRSFLALHLLFHSVSLITFQISHVFPLVLSVFFIFFQTSLL